MAMDKIFSAISTGVWEMVSMYIARKGTHVYIAIASFTWKIIACNYVSAHMS